MKRGGDALGLETNTLKGGGPYWILFHYAKGPVVKPIYMRATDNCAKILYMAPRPLPGFQEVLVLAGAAPKNLPDGNHF
jgi:hypothetical protein